MNAILQKGLKDVRIRAVVASLILLGGLWLVVAVGVAGIFRISLPEAVLVWAPWDARAKATLADHLIANKQDSGTFAKVRRLASDALERDAYSVVALRDFGLSQAQAGNMGPARATFLLANTLSKRDLGVHLWLIEDSVGRSDIRGALTHYDEALRTSASARNMLLPVLVQASDDPAIAGPLREFIAKRPPWSPEFFSTLVDHGSPSAPLYSLAKSWGGYRVKDDWWVAQKLIGRLYREKRFDQAYDIFLGSVGVAQDRAPLVYNGGFNSSPYFSPFDWQLINDEVSNASIDRIDGGGALFSTVQAGRAVVATITIVLRPGSYELTSRGQSLDASQTVQGRWLVRCEDEINDQLAAADFGPANLSSELVAGARFSVPARGCRGQTLVLERFQASEDSDAGLAVRSVAIRRIAR